MAAYSDSASVQPTFDYGRGRARPGQRPRALAYQTDPVAPACVDPTPNVSQVTTVTFTAANAGEAMQLKIDGAVVPFTSVGTNNGNASALDTAIEAQLDEGDLLASIVATSVANSAVVTLTFSDYVPHTVELVAPGTTAATIADSTDASAEVRHKAGTFVARQTTQGDPTVCKVKLPDDAADKILGVIEEGGYPNHQTPPNPYGLAADEAYPYKAPFPVHDRGEWCVRIAGTVNPGDPIYVKTMGAKKGYAVAASDAVAAVSQVTEGTIVPNNGDTVGLTIDALPNVTVTSTASAAATAILLANAINLRDDLKQIVDATINSDKVVLRFKDDQTHTVVAVSPATADVTPITTTTTAVEAVAATVIKFRGQFTEARTSAQGTAYVNLDAPTPV